MIKRKYKFYSLKQILNRNAQYNIIIGERSNGKTYACLEYGLTQYAKTKKQMAIVRRTKEDYTGRRGSSMFDSLVVNGVVAKVTGGEWTDVYYFGSRWFLCRYDEKGNRERDETPFCFGFALSTSEHDKSTSYPNVTTIVFDEFITRTYYLTDEFTLFTNLISTIIRQRNDVIIFMLGNTVNKYGCPYVTEMGLKHFKEMKPGDIDVYRYGETELCVAVEYCKPDSVSKANNYYFAFNNPKLSMITSGTWEINVYPHLPRKYTPKDVVCHILIQYMGEWLHGEIVALEDTAFLFVHPKTKPLTDNERYNSLIFSPEFSELPNWHRRITEPTDKITKRIAQFIFTDKVFYSSNDVGEIMRNYLLWCRKSDI